MSVPTPSTSASPGPVTTPSVPAVGAPVPTPSSSVAGLPVLPGIQSALNAGNTLQVATQVFGATNVCIQNVGDVAGVARIDSPLGFETYLPVNAGQLSCITHSFAGLPVSVSNLTLAPLAVTSKLPMTDHTK